MDEAAAVMGDPKARAQFFDQSNVSTPSLDLDKMWDGLNFLICAEDSSDRGEGSFLVDGNQLIAVGESSARVFEPKDLHRLCASLAIDDEELARRYVPRAMMVEEVYPMIWERDPAEDDLLAELTKRFHELRDFMVRAAKDGRALVVFNEWPASRETLAPNVPERKLRWIGHMLAATLAGSIAAVLVLLIPEGGSPAKHTIPAFYCVMLWVIVVGWDSVKRLLPIKVEGAAKWERYADAIETAALVQALILTLFLLIWLPK